MRITDFWGEKAERLRKTRNPSNPEHPNLPPDFQIGAADCYLVGDEVVVRAGNKALVFTKAELVEMLSKFPEK